MLFRMASGFSQQAGFRLSGICPRFPLNTGNGHVILSKVQSVEQAGEDMEPIKVFIVEDESIVREGIRDMIPWEQYGFVFSGEAPDGEVALPMVRRIRPDILITDIKMPFMDGLSLSRLVNRELPDTRIIILSGYDDFEYAQQAIELHVDQYLLKPISRANMIKALEQTRSRIQEEREQKEYRQVFTREAREYEA